VSTANDVPAGWAQGVIGDLIGEGGLFADGDWVETKDQTPNGDVRLIQLADVGDGEFLDKSARFLTKERAATFLAVGDVLVARMPDPLGRAAIFPGDSKASITAVDVCIVRPARKEASTRWLMHAINSPQFRARVAALQSGSTRKRISRGNLARVSLQIPPSKEQQRIAAKCDELLSALDAGVAALERARANLNRYRAAVLRAAVEGRLTEKWRAAHPDVEPASARLERILAERRKRSEEAQLKKYADKGQSPPKGWKDKYREPVKPDVAWLPGLPAGWCWVTVDQLSSEVKNGSARAPAKDAVGYRILRINAVRRMSVDLEETRQVDLPEREAQEARIRNGDLLFTRYNGSPELVGVAGLVRGLTSEILHPDKLIRVRVLDGAPSKEFLELACNVGASREHIRKRTRIVDDNYLGRLTTTILAG
jgi:type I restriction enzyme, S subunit